MLTRKELNRARLQQLVWHHRRSDLHLKLADIPAPTKLLLTNAADQQRAIIIFTCWPGCTHSACQSRPCIVPPVVSEIELEMMKRCVEVSRLYVGMATTRWPADR